MMIFRPQGIVTEHPAGLPVPDKAERRTSRRRRDMDSVLTVNRLTMDFGGLRALDAVDLEVGQGEIVALIGPNGAGKTTFFNCITGIYTPTAGDIFISPPGGRSPADQRRQDQPGHGTGHGPDLSEHPPFPQHDGPGKRHDRPPLPGEGRRPGGGPPGQEDQARRSRRSSTGATRSSSRSALPTRWTTWRKTSPTAPSAAWRSPGRWPPSPSCCSWTNRRPG